MRRLHFGLALLMSFIWFLPDSMGQKARENKYHSVELQELSTFYQTNQKEKAAKYNGSFLLHLQFTNLPTKDSRQALENAGIQLHEFVSNNTYLASIPETLSLEKAKGLGIVACALKKPEQKLVQQLLEKNYPEHCVKGNRLELAFNFQKVVDPTVIKEVLATYDVEILEDKHRGGYTITGLIDANKVEAIAKESLITFIDVVTPPVEKLMNEVRSLQQVNFVNAANGKNLNGAGVTMGIGDGGELGNHLDFEGRIINHANGHYASFGDHGDHVAGIAGGSGILNPRHRGIASLAELVIQKTSLITLYSPDYYADHNMTLTNNSYGTSFNCDLNGTYNYTSQTLDIQLRDYPEILHVFAAGNSGTQTCAPFPAGFNTLLRYYQSAKNVLTVGNVNTNRIIKSNSSRGPALDGRLKPEICGIGSSVMSTGRTFNYKNKSGTSMASPAVMGTLALFTESYKLEHSGNNPPSGLLKAIACNTADDLGNVGPDYTYGYGLINARRGVETIENGYHFTSAVSDGNSNTHTITVPSGMKQVKVMLYWHDKEAETYPDVALVNNLDMVMTSPSSTDYLPWVLDPTPTNVDNLATRQVDDLNNIEQVTLDNPASGNYTITISGTEIPFGPQDYFLVYEFVTDDVILTSPLGGETFTPGINELIQWDVDACNTSTFTVKYSIDGGSNWTVLDNNVGADERFYNWTVPMSFTENAFVSVSKNNGSSDDENDVAFNILDQPIITVQPACFGKVQIDWNAVAGADLYEVLMFDGTEMVSLDTTSSLEFLLEDASLIIGEQYWFSIVPKTTSGKYGTRAVAQDCVPQLNVMCPWPDDLFVEGVWMNKRGRAGTNTGLTNSELITAKIRNIGNNNVSNFDIFYSVNGGSAVMETYTGTLNSGDSLSYVFNQTLDMNPEGIYDVDVWANLNNDVHNNNDSLLNKNQAEQLGNESVVLYESPIDVDFQTTNTYFYSENRIGLDELYKWDFETTVDGTLEIGGTNQTLALLIDDNATEIAPNYKNSATFTVNLGDHNPSLGLALDFVFSNNNLFPLEEGPELINKLYVRGSDTDVWLELYSMDETETGWHEITGLNVLNVLIAEGQSLTQSFQVRFEENGKGLLVDNVVLYQTSSLPVDLTKFTAERIGSNALLSWTTASEENNKYFEVEVAASKEALINSSFEVIGMVDGKGTTSELNDYTFEDKTPGKNGFRYYRLRQVDYDGKYEYSEIKIVDFTIQKEPVSIYPNPTTDFAIIDIEEISATHISVQLIDASGEVYQAFEYEEADGLERLRLDLWEVPPGMYFVRLKLDDIVQTFPLVKENKG